MATLQDVYDQTIAALEAEQFEDAARGLSVLEAHAASIEESALRQVRVRVFVGAARAGLSQVCAGVLAGLGGTEQPRFATLVDAAQGLATATEAPLARVAHRSLELLALVASEDERTQAVAMLGTGAQSALSGPFEEGLGTLVHRQIPVPWWPELLARLEAQFAAAEEWVICLLSYATQDSIDDVPEAVFGQHVGERPAGYAAWMAIKPAFPMLINVLCQQPEALAAARERKELRRVVASLDRYHPHITHLRACLETLADAPFLILHPERRQGFEVRVRGVNHMESLQTLMHAALHGDPSEGKLAAPRPAESIIEVVSGVSDHMQSNELTSNVWGLFTWPALRDDGALTGVDTAALMRAQLSAQGLDASQAEIGANFIPADKLDDAQTRELFATRSGELPAVEAARVALDEGDPAPYRYKIDDQGRPGSIPELDGRRVILLTGRTRLARWQALRQFPYMRGELVVESVLSPAQVDAALARIRAARSERVFLEVECESWHLAGISERNIAGPAKARPILERAYDYALRLGDSARIVEVGQTLDGCVADEPGADVALWRRALQAMDAAGEATQVKDRVLALYMLGASHGIAGQLGEAEQAYTYARGWLAHVEGEHMLRARVLTVLGRTFMRQGRFEQAEEPLLAAIAALEHAKEPVRPLLERIEIRRQLTSLALRAGNFEAAETHLLHASRTAREGLSEWHPEVAFTMELLGDLNAGIGNEERSAQCFHKAAHLLAGTRHAAEQAGLQAAAADANAELRRGDLRTALRRLERHQAIAVELLGADHEVAVQGRETIASVRAQLDE